MVKEIILTPLAISDYDNIIEYLMSEWGISVTNDFIERFQNARILLAKNPGIFPFQDKVKQVQKCFLTKQNILYFKETDEVIKIITIFDTRQNPSKLTSIV